MQRLIEIWGAIPELYLLIIFASIFEPSLLLLLVLLSLLGWIGLSDYVRAEFLRNRSLEFVKAARAMGLSNAQIIWRHVLPNSMTPVITFLPFRMSAAILALTSLDFLGLGVPSPVPSLGDLLRQGKANLDAWWIIVPTFVLLVADDAAADLHRRRAARRLRHAQVMSRPYRLPAYERAARRRAPERPLRRLARSSTTCRSRSRARREVRAGRRVGLGQVGHRAVGAAAASTRRRRAARSASTAQELMQESEREMRGMRGARDRA